MGGVRPPHPLPRKASLPQHVNMDLCLRTGGAAPALISAAAASLRPGSLGGIKGEQPANPPSRAASAASPPPSASL